VRLTLDFLAFAYYDRGKLIYDGSLGADRSIQLSRAIMAAL
jgi:hypothetical protein